MTTTAPISSAASQGEGEAAEVPRFTTRQLRMLRHVHGYRQRAALCNDRRAFTPAYRLARVLTGAGR